MPKVQPMTMFVCVKMHTIVGYPVANERNTLLAHLQASDIPGFEYVKFAGSARLAFYAEVRVKSDKHIKHLHRAIEAYTPAYETSWVFTTDVLPYSVEDADRLDAEYAAWLAERGLSV